MEQILKYLRLIWLSKTEHLSVPIKSSTVQGKKVGEGACKAVVLRLNNFTRNDIAGGAIAATYFYYGDGNGQERECLRGVSSDIIFCENLNQVYVRCPFAADITIQVIVYR